MLFFSCGGGKSDSQDGYTALIFAVQHHHTDCVRLLLDAGADKEVRGGEVRNADVVLFSVTWRSVSCEYFEASLLFLLCLRCAVIGFISLDVSVFSSASIEARL